MGKLTHTAVLLISLFTISNFITVPSAGAGQVPGSSASPDIPVSQHDRVYTADQFSNVVTVTAPVNNKLLGVINLGQVGTESDYRTERSGYADFFT